MEKQFTRLQLFSLTDGRLSTSISDVYDILNYIFDKYHSSTDLVLAIEQLKKANPEWYIKEVKFIENLKKELGDDDFDMLVTHIYNNCNELIYVPKLKN